MAPAWTEGQGLVSTVIAVEGVKGVGQACTACACAACACVHACMYTKGRMSAWVAWTAGHVVSYVSTDCLLLLLAV